MHYERDFSGRLVRDARGEPLMQVIRGRVEVRRLQQGGAINDRSQSGTD
jgi:hypothetical protein